MTRRPSSHANRGKVAEQALDRIASTVVRR
jgi:hypothetical protein